MHVYVVILLFCVVQLRVDADPLIGGVEVYFPDGEQVRVGGTLVSDDAPVMDDGFKHSEYVKAKVVSFTEEEIEKAKNAARELEKDVEMKEVKPVHPFPIVRLGIGYGIIVSIMVVFPFLVYGLRKIVEKVREWRKPRLY